MEALIRAGERREQAAKRVARVLKQIGYKFPSKSKAEWRTVAEMRDEARRSLARKSGFYEEYDNGLLWLEHEMSEGKDPAEFAKQILGWLSAMRL
jgi:hypothetical protein